MADKEKLNEMEMDPDLKEFGVSLHDVHDLLNNNAWKAMQAIMRRRLEELKSELILCVKENKWDTDENGRVVLVRSGMERLQGQCVEDILILALPQDFINTLTGEENESDTRSN
jgi:hypothetical protein